MKTRITDRRHLGERRWGLGMDFPLRDCDGILIVTERRTRCDRRLDNTTLAERLLMFSGAIPVDALDKQH